MYGGTSIYGEQPTVNAGSVSQNWQLFLTECREQANISRRLRAEQQSAAGAADYPTNRP